MAHKLEHKIIGTRNLGELEKAVDLIWFCPEGCVLREDGATEIPDQINIRLDLVDYDEYLARNIRQHAQDLAQVVSHQK